MAGPHDESRWVCPHRRVFLEREVEPRSASTVAALADEQLVFGLGELAGQARDVLVHLAKHGLPAGELVRSAHTERSSLLGAGGWCTQIPRSSERAEDGDSRPAKRETGVAPPLPNFGLLP